MGEIVVLDPRKGEREMPIGEIPRQALIRHQGDRLPLPDAPRPGRCQLRSLIVTGQAFAIGLDHVTAFGLWDGRQKAFELLREHLRDAELVIPVHLRLCDGIDAPQDQFAHTFGMGLCIGQRQR